MNGSPLESARAKISRAKVHLNQLRAQIDADGKKEAYGILLYRYTDIHEIVARANLPRKLFAHYSVFAGEVVHQARSALEYAIWEMVPSPKNSTGFPVFFVESHYESRGRPMVNGINPTAEAIIKGLQPFGPNYKTDTLWILNEFWKWDKHRLPSLCIGNEYLGASLYYQFPDGHFSQQAFTFPRDMEDCTELFRVSDPGPEVKVHVEYFFVPRLAFRDGPAAEKPVAEFLLGLVQFAESIIDILAETI
jgi:hypothetical protein